MEKIWNYIHSTIYYLVLILFNLLSYIDPFIYIFKIPFIKKAFEKKGIKNPNKQINNIVFKNRETGWLSIWSSIQMGGLLVFIEWSLFNFLQAALGKSLIQYVWEDSTNKIIFIICFLIPPGLINYFLLWKDDKYLAYFEEFEKEPKAVKRKWAWISFGMVIWIIGLLILSFWVLTKSIHR